MLIVIYGFFLCLCMWLVHDWVSSFFGFKMCVYFDENVLWGLTFYLLGLIDVQYCRSWSRFFVIRCVVHGSVCVVITCCLFGLCVSNKQSLVCLLVIVKLARMLVSLSLGLVFATRIAVPVFSLTYF